MPILCPTPLAVFVFEFLVLGLIWAVWAVLNLWIWQKTKSNANLLMLVGSGLMGVLWLINTFSYSGGSFWLHVLGLVLLTAGFYLSVRPMVDAQIAALRAKIGQAAGGSKKDGGSPPPSA